MTTPTPRTDAEEQNQTQRFGLYMVKSGFARQLESELATVNARYEYVRKLNPRQFAELYQKNITTGIHFDDLVDMAVAEKIP